MQLKITKQNFLRALTRTHAVADRKSSMPILSNVLVTTEANRLRFATTDLYLGVTTVVEASVETQGSLAIPAKTLFDIVKNLPPGEIQLRKVDGSVEIRAGKIRYKIPAMPGEDFPPLANSGDAAFSDLPAERLSQLIAHTQFSMSNDDTRPHLAGALFESDGSVLRMVTTDGHRLSRAQIDKASPGYEFSMLVPHKGIVELRRLIDDAKLDAKSDQPNVVSIATSAGYAFFRRGEAELSVKLVDEKFPPYANVIPKNHTRKVILARSLLIETLRRISLVASDKSGGVRFQLEEGLLRINSQNPDVGEGTEDVAVDYVGDPVTIGFNARYVLDVLNAMTSDEIQIELSGELDPGAICPVGEDIDFVGVIMPMRI